LKEDTYLLHGKSYHMARHGFARDTPFAVAEEKDQVTLTLESSEATLKQYPFPFVLSVHYLLRANMLLATYRVLNTGEERMYFSLGAHPAFKVPMVDNTSYEDHFLLFDTVEDAPRWPILDSGLIAETPAPFLQHTDTLKLSKGLFAQDAVVLKQLKSRCVSLRATSHLRGLDFSFEGFPFLGIWAAKNADFVCIEPWCGIADSVHHDQQLPNKEGIQTLAPGETWSRTWTAKFF
jgi:galactose mutarotase-like enzyme